MVGPSSRTLEPTMAQLAHNQMALIAGGHFAFLPWKEKNGRVVKYKPPEVELTLFFKAQWKKIQYFRKNLIAPSHQACERNVPPFIFSPTFFCIMLDKLRPASLPPKGKTALVAGTEIP